MGVMEGMVVLVDMEESPVVIAVVRADLGAEVTTVLRDRQEVEGSWAEREEPQAEQVEVKLSQAPVGVAMTIRLQVGAVGPEAVVLREVLVPQQPEAGFFGTTILLLVLGMVVVAAVGDKGAVAAAAAMRQETVTHYLVA